MVLSQNGQFLSCATVALSVRYADAVSDSAVLECCCVSCAVSKTVLVDIFSLLGCYAAQVDSFGTTCQSHIYKSGVVGFKVGPIGCYETSATSNLRCLTFQKSKDLVYAATEV